MGIWELSVLSSQLSANLKLSKNKFKKKETQMASCPIKTIAKFLPILFFFNCTVSFIYSIGKKKKSQAHRNSKIVVARGWQGMGSANLFQLIT